MTGAAQSLNCLFGESWSAWNDGSFLASNPSLDQGSKYRSKKNWEAKFFSGKIAKRSEQFLYSAKNCEFRNEKKFFAIVPIHIAHSEPCLDCTKTAAACAASIPTILSIQKLNQQVWRPLASLANVSTNSGHHRALFQMNGPFRARPCTPLQVQNLGWLSTICALLNRTCRRYSQIRAWDNLVYNRRRKCRRQLGKSRDQLDAAAFACNKRAGTRKSFATSLRRLDKFGSGRGASELCRARAIQSERPSSDPWKLNNRSWAIICW